MIWSHSNWATYLNIGMIFSSVHQSFLLLTPHIFNQVLISICAIILMLQTSLLFISALLGWELSNEPCFIFLYVVINDTGHGPRTRHISNLLSWETRQGPVNTSWVGWAVFTPFCTQLRPGRYWHQVRVITSLIRLVLKCYDSMKVIWSHS